MLLGFTMFLSLVHHSAADHDVNSNLNESIIKNEVDMSQATADTTSFSEGGSGRRVLQALADDKFRWPKGVLYYAFDSTVSHQIRGRVRSAVQDLQRQVGGSCVTFREVKEYDRPHYHVKVSYSSVGHGSGGSANTGYLGIADSAKIFQERGYQDLTLVGTLLAAGTIQHEFLHALGLAHTQTRSDRDKYIIIPEQSKVSNPKAYYDNYFPPPFFEQKNFGLPYNYRSIMHYADNIKTRDPLDQDKIGSQILSKGDAQLVRLMYKCDKTGAKGNVKWDGSNSAQPNECKEQEGDDLATCMGGDSNWGKRTCQEWSGYCTNEKYRDLLTCCPVACRQPCTATNPATYYQSTTPPPTYYQPQFLRRRQPYYQYHNGMHSGWNQRTAPQSVNHGWVGKIYRGTPNLFR